MTPTPRLAIANVAGTLLFLGLAVLGWGSLSDFLSHPAFIALTVVLCGLVVASLFAGGSLSSGVREDRANRWVIFVIGFIGLLSPWLAAYTDRVVFWTIDGDGVRWLGVFLFAAGGILRILPVFVLGHRFSGLVAIQPGHELVTSGLYGVIRHPSYHRLLISSLGWVLAFRSGVGVLLTLLLIVPIVARIRSEENLLHEQFGSEYDAYRARTSRLIPGVY